MPMEIAYQPPSLNAKYFSLVATAFIARQLQFSNQNTMSGNVQQPAA